MRSISLDGKWQLTALPPTAEPVTDPRGLRSCGVSPIPATVPGNVELDLQAAGIIDDPFFGKNILSLREFEHYNWWYGTTFRTPQVVAGERVSIRFEGIDTFGTVWLNGKSVGTTDNMLIPHEFDITDGLRPAGETNELHVTLESPLARAAEFRYEPTATNLPTNLEQAYVRKAPHMYGWDIMPRAVSAGLWRSVYLDVHREPEIGDLFVRTDRVSPGEASLSFRWQIDGAPALMHRCKIRVRGVCGESVLTALAQCRFVAGDFSIHVPEPRVWWPRGYGEPDLYDTLVELLLDDEVVDTRRFSVGIRTTELVRTDTTSLESAGEFLFRVNGEPILIKGTNWVPADAFHSRDKERIPKIMERLAEVNCNMVRCWGGNVYEDDTFFDLCDSMGVMVWQDFSMACGRYPQDGGFADALRKEAEHVVRKLRNHPSLAVWAGDNECDECYAGAGLDPNTNRLTRDVLPGVLRRLDPWRPYVPSSPYYSPAVWKAGTVEAMPERHLWGPRDYYKSGFYEEHRAHFVSEIGYHGCPNRSSLEKFLSEGSLWPPENNEEWRIHAADTTETPGAYAYRIALMSRQIAEVFGSVPSSLDEFIFQSQIVQAEAKKHFVEMTRLGKWRRTGVLWWNLMDGWPQFSDAVIDYYFGVKLAFHYLRRVQQPVCIMLDEPKDWHCRVVLGNDSLSPAEGSFRVWDAETGETALEAGFRGQSNANLDLGRIPVCRGTKKVFLISWSANGKEGGNHYLLGTPPFDAEWYRGLLPSVAALPGGFDWTAVGK